jgi:hypothetical protein
MRKNLNHQNRKQKKEPKQGPWDLSRRRFLASAVLGAAAVQLPFHKLQGQIKDSQEILDENQFSILASVQEILFPGDGNGPGAHDLHAAEYLIWVLSDKEKDPEEVQYIIDGIGWVDETAEEEESKKYLELSPSEREKLIETISNESWGESWLSVILSFIFEALLCDPQYKGNPKEAGWDWLRHDPGQPRPREKDLYPGILRKKTAPG